MLQFSADGYYIWHRAISIRVTPNRPSLMALARIEARDNEITISRKSHYCYLYFLITHSEALVVALPMRKAGRLLRRGEGDEEKQIGRGSPVVFIPGHP